MPAPELSARQREVVQAAVVSSDAPSIPDAARRSRPRGRQAARGQVGPAADGRRPYLVVAGLALSFSVFTLLGTWC